MTCNISKKQLQRSLKRKKAKGFLEEGRKQNGHLKVLLLEQQCERQGETNPKWRLTMGLNTQERTRQPKTMDLFNANTVDDLSMKKQQRDIFLTALRRRNEKISEELFSRNQ